MEMVTSEATGLTGWWMSQITMGSTSFSPKPEPVSHFREACPLTLRAGEYNYVCLYSLELSNQPK